MKAAAKQEMINAFFDEKLKASLHTVQKQIRVLRNALMEMHTSGRMCPDTFDEISRL